MVKKGFDTETKEKAKGKRRRAKEKGKREAGTGENTRRSLHLVPPIRFSFLPFFPCSPVSSVVSLVYRFSFYSECVRNIQCPFADKSVRFP
ncbi:MAG: hypothetical protein D6679_10905 [Candidatus Hydrogenedentota bacterium]|nr:MAG: hypothetical protein D6679_10905 [Candidatus Hydrogenedentota bacterium]